MKRTIYSCLRSKVTKLKLLSKEHSPVESMQQAIADEAAVREFANFYLVPLLQFSLNFVKSHPPSKNYIKTDKPKHTATFKLHANLKSSANSKFQYTCYSCSHVVVVVCHDQVRCQIIQSS